MAKIYYEIVNENKKQSKKTSEKEKGGVSALSVILCTVPFALLAVFYIFRGDASFANAVISGFSKPYREFVGRLCSKVPVSVMEILYVIFGGFALVYIIKTIVLLVKRKRKLRLLLKRVFILLVILLYVWSGYCWFWGIDYYGYDTKTNPVRIDELIYVTELFAEKTNELSVQVNRDENGLFSEDMDAYFSHSTEIYDNIKSEFPQLSGEIYTPKKMIFSEVMSYLGFTGIYFPFTGESNINVLVPQNSIPCTIAHELAHQQGIFSEQEANFYGIAACVSSENIAYEYSGYMTGLIHLMNSLYRTDKDAWREIRATFTPELEADWQNHNNYWKTYETEVAETAGKVYNIYLQSNGQELGVKSYGACVDLLVEYYKDK